MAQLLPVAVIERWSTRKLAAEVGVDASVATRVLRSVADQHNQAQPSAGLIKAARDIRDGVAKAAKAAVATITAAAAAAKTPAELERLTRAMEGALRVADNLDGLAHLRASELRGREQAQTAPRGVTISDLLTSADSPIPSDSPTFDGEFRDSDSPSPSAARDEADS